MDYNSSVYPEYYSNLEPSTTTTFNMYSQQKINSLNKEQLLNESISQNKNFNLRMYSTKQSLSVDSMMNQPKETLWQSILNVPRSTTNFLTERLTRSKGSIIKKWSSMGDPLSVTVVSTEFYKSLQQSKDHQLVNSPSENYEVAKRWSHSSYEIFPNILFSNDYTNGYTKRSLSDSSDIDKRWKEYKEMYVNDSQSKNLVLDDKIMNKINSADCKEKSAMASQYDGVTDELKITDTSTNFGNTLDVKEALVTSEDIENKKMEQPQSLQDLKLESKETSDVQPTAVSTIMSNVTNVYNKVVDLFRVRSTSPETESPELFTKRAGLPKPRPKKVYNITTGRGRGRTKFRKSSLNQAQHKKERNKCKSNEIKDLQNMEEFEYSSTEDEDVIEDVDVCDFASSKSSIKDDDDLYQYMRHESNFTLADIKPSNMKQHKGKKHGWTEINVSITVKNLEDDDEIEEFPEKQSFRSRLLSESSVESDDSYCIVFENPPNHENLEKLDIGSGNESDEIEDNYIRLKPETKTEDKKSEDKKSEDKKSEDKKSEDKKSEDRKSEDNLAIKTTKVHFNLDPVVHEMIYWNFAYRAARIGEWEMVARDRVRFKDIIQRTGRKIEHVFSKQHRDRIYRERFAEADS